MSLDQYRKAVQLAEEIAGKLDELDDIAGCFEEHITQRVGYHTANFAQLSREIQHEAYVMEAATYMRLTGKIPTT